MNTSRLAFVFLIFVIFPVLPSQAQAPEALAFLSQINAYRLASPACWDGGQMRPWPAGSSPELGLSAALSRAAWNHDTAMAQQGCTDHTCAGESELPQRVIEAGYPPRWDFLSENIAGGFETAGDVMAAWQGSPGHNRNMLACAARVVGIARLYDPTTLHWWYWTTDFGDVVDAAPAQLPARLPLGKAMDADGNHVLDDDEILVAIDDWVRGTTVTGLNAPIDDDEIATLIGLWITGARL